MVSPPRTSIMLVFVAAALAALATASVPEEEGGSKQDGRAFSLFTIVNFPNDQCTTQTDETLLGTCYSSTECSDKSGEADGNCASGFGVCCLFKLDCGGTIDQNCTYIQNPGYPSSYSITTVTACAYTVSPTDSSNICQLRLDFDNFVIAAPPTTTGACSDTFIAAGPTGRNPPTICGTNTGQHMYVETGKSSTATTLTFSLDGTNSATRTYRVKVAMIPCDSSFKAPTDCVKYYIGTHGETTTYGFSSGSMLQSQEHATCVRREVGHCKLQWTTTSITSPDPFGLGPVNAISTFAALPPTSCDISYVVIPTEAIAVPKFCGGNLNTQGQTIAANSPTTSAAITSTGTPFRIYTFSTAGNQAANVVGYSLHYAQVPC